MKLKAVRGEIVPAAFAEYKISQGSGIHLWRTMMMISLDDFSDDDDDDIR